MIARYTLRHLYSDCRRDFDANTRSFTTPGLHALIAYRLVHNAAEMTKPWNSIARPIGKTIIRLMRNFCGIEIHPAADISPGISIPHAAGIVIADGAVIGSGCVIRSGVVIGVRSNDQRHLVPKIGENVHIGANAVITGDVRIGDNVRIGPLANVFRDVPAGATVVGSPGEVLRTAHDTAGSFDGATPIISTPENRT